MIIKRYLAILWVMLFFTGCSTYSIMPNHDPDGILKDKTARRMQDSLPSLKGKTIILELVADLSTQPTGACLDDKLDDITNVNLSFLIPHTGYVLFEKIADGLKSAKAVVYRRYPGQSTKSVRIPANASYVAVTVRSVEYHIYRDSKEHIRHLASAQVSYRIGSAEATSETIRVNADVPRDKDGFVVLAERFVTALAPKL